LLQSEIGDIGLAGSDRDLLCGEPSFPHHLCAVTAFSFGIFAFDRMNPADDMAASIEYAIVHGSPVNDNLLSLGFPVKDHGIDAEITVDAHGILHPGFKDWIISVWKFVQNTVVTSIFSFSLRLGFL
jgi:hypothetical protein